MARKLSVARLDSGRVDAHKTAFAIEFSKDYKTMRAAKTVGIHPDTGRQWVNDPHVVQILNTIMRERAEQSHVDAEWLLHELMDNHQIARAEGNINASNTALGMIGKLGAVDAFAADKLEVATGADVVERLQRSRRRVMDHKGHAIIEHDPQEGEAGIDGGHPRNIDTHTAAIKNEKNFSEKKFIDFDKINDKNSIDFF